MAICILRPDCTRRLRQGNWHGATPSAVPTKSGCLLTPDPPQLQRDENHARVAASQTLPKRLHRLCRHQSRLVPRYLRAKAGPSPRDLEGGSGSATLACRFWRAEPLCRLHKAKRCASSITSAAQQRRAGSLQPCDRRIAAMGFMKARAERQMMDQVFNLKFTSKQLNKASKKAEKDEKVMLHVSARSSMMPPSTMFTPGCSRVVPVPTEAVLHAAGREAAGEGGHREGQH